MANPSILVVDDSSAMRQNLCQLLIKKGYEPTCCQSGEEAAKALLAKPYDIILTDIIMPGMSGLTLLKLIKERSPDTDVVIVTSNASSFTAIKALRLGAYDFIVKPVDDEEILHSVLSRALEKRRLANENRRLVDDLSEKNRSLEEAVRMMRGLNDACGLISSTLEIGEILRRLVESAVETLGARKGYLLLLDRSSGYFHMKVCVGIDGSVAKNFLLPMNAGIAGKVAETGDPVRLGTKIPAEAAQRLLEEDVTGELFSSPGILSVPLKIDGKVAGVACISGRASGKEFGQAEIEFLTALANHAAIALKNAGMYYRLKKNAA